MVERIITGVAAKTVAGTMVNANDKWAVNLVISAAMRSTIGMIGAVLTPHELGGGKVTCKKCGD